MTYDFDRHIDRRGTNALAQDGFEGYLFGGGEPPALPVPREDLIAMWVADMQFAAPKAALDAMAERLTHPIFGYTMNFGDELYEAFHAWCVDRYGWSFAREEMQTSLGVIPALFALTDYLCEPGDKVLGLAPSYGYFRHAAEHRGCEFVTSPLVTQDGGHFIDFADFEARASDPRTKLFFLCHPHNPTGRMWSEAELRRMAEICFRHDVTIVSDEIHCDLLRKGRRHVPLAKLFPGCKDVITCMAVSKTFNLAGMMIASIVIPDPELRAIWKKRHYPFVNPVSLAAATGAYRDGGPWLDALQGYLDGNFIWLLDFLAVHLPQARFMIPDATYLAWIDLGAYFPQPVNFTRFFIEKAGVMLEGGEMFVANGENMIRLNLACPRTQLEDVLTRMRDAILIAAPLAACPSAGRISHRSR
jgi:cystathionine beta-lyase